MRRICLHTIVRNNEQIILPMLQSVSPFIDYYVVISNKSTDNTLQIITEYFSKLNISGEVHHMAFQNNDIDKLNHTLSLCKNKALYTLVMSPKERIVGEFILPSALDHDLYYLNDKRFYDPYDIMATIPKEIRLFKCDTVEYCEFPMGIFLVYAHNNVTKDEIDGVYYIGYQ